MYDSLVNRSIFQLNHIIDCLISSYINSYEIETEISVENCYLLNKKLLERTINLNHDLIMIRENPGFYDHSFEFNNENIIHIETKISEKKNNKFEEYKYLIESTFAKTTPDEYQLSIKSPNYYDNDDILGKVLYIQDTYLDNLLVGIEDKYYINICTKPEAFAKFGFNSGSELIDNIVNNKDTFWEYARSYINKLYLEQ